MNARDLPLQQAPVTFTLNGREVEATPGESLLDVACRVGVSIPHLCHSDGLRSVGNCRACVVEVAGERVLAPSCCRAPQPGMVVSSNSPRASAAQKTVLELLLADAPDTQTLKHDSELAQWAAGVGARAGHFAGRHPNTSVRPELVEGLAQTPHRLRQAQPELMGGVASATTTHSPVHPEPVEGFAPSGRLDTSHPAMSVNLDACIQCTRCIRACRETQGNDVLGLAFRGGHAQIVFDQADPMGASTCVACGECVQACPTGAIAPANGAFEQPPQQTVDSVCPFCGVGCQLSYGVTEGKITQVTGIEGPANEGRLCVKGRFGFDYAHSPERLTRPLIRRAGAPKDPADVVHRLNPERIRELFREASWEEALDVAAAGFQTAMASTTQRGRLAPVAGFGSAKGTNEEAYLFQKLIRSAFATHNVDHCTRLCHASSVAALMEGLGSAVVTNPLRDVQHADFVLVIGANPAQNHPVGATWIKNAVKRGTMLVMADPRRTELARHAWKHLGFTAGTDVALLNALLHTIIDEGLTDAAYIEQHTLDFALIQAHVADFSPEAMAPVCGIAAEEIRAVARAYASAGNSMILWGMGISQHTHGTDNARCLIALSLITGQIGRPGTGLHPLRGQNNVQGASDAGLIPMVLPDYHRVGDAGARGQAEAAWGLAPGTLGSEPGLTVVEIVDAAYDRQIRAMLIQGENPAMSDPDATHAREAFARLDHLVVQDIFLTETAILADVVLPATAWPEKTGSVTNTDRIVQLGRKAVPAPGEARADAWITEQLARRLGLPWAYNVAADGSAVAERTQGIGAVFEEMRGLMPSIAGLSWTRLQREGAVTYPVASDDDPGQPVVFTDRFPTATGRATLVPAALTAPAETPDADYPLVLITGRQLEHWHTGSMTRRSSVLDALEPAPVVSLHPGTAERLGLKAGDTAQVRSRRGAVQLPVRLDSGMPVNTAFIPFAYAEAAANLLTNPALDPLGKIAELKYCAVEVRAAAA